MDKITGTSYEKRVDKELKREFRELMERKTDLRRMNINGQPKRICGMSRIVGGS